MRYSCGAVVGHGQKCEPNYQCDACAAKQEYKPRIEKLETALRLMLSKCAWEKRGQWCGSLDCHCRIARKTLEGKDG